MPDTCHLKPLFLPNNTTTIQYDHSIFQSRLFKLCILYIFYFHSSLQLEIFTHYSHFVHTLSIFKLYTENQLEKGG